MSNLKKMYTLSVPCITNFIADDRNIDISEYPDKLWISDKCICRISDNSLLILNGLYQAFYSDDIELEYFKEGFFLRKKDFTPGVIQQLVKKHIIDLESDGTRKPSVHYYNKCISAYYATLEITQRCNAQCKHCYNGYERCTTEPSLNTIKTRIRKLKELGIQYIEVTGGEPLLRRDIADIIGFIKEMGLKYCIATNGLLVKEHLDILNDAESVSISLDGDSNYHNMIRGVPLYDKVIEALQLLNECGVRTLISMTVTDNNAHLVQHVVSVAERFSAEVILAAVVPSGKAKDKTLNDFLSEIKVDQFTKVYGDSLRRPKVEINKEPFYYGCDMGRKGFTVSISGEVLPCLFMRNFSIGQLEDFTIEKYNQTIFELCKARRTSVNICETCKDEKCGGVCIFSRTHLKRRKKEYLSADEYCKEIWSKSI